MLDRSTVRLLEREGELEQLARDIGDARAGRGRAVVVEGPAGIGKTGLLQSAIALAREEGMAVAEARGGEVEREQAYGVVRELLVPVFEALSSRERSRILGGSAKLAIPVLEPGSGAIEGGADPVYPAMHGLYWLATELASREPLVLAIDDAHWADTSSLRFLAFAARRLDSIPLLLLIATRQAEPGANREQIDQIAADPGATIMRLASLSAAAVSDLVRREFDPEATDGFCAACYEASAGNPFLIYALIEEARAEGFAPDDESAGRVLGLSPESVARVVLVRLAQLPPEASELAKSVAVLGRDAEWRHAAELAGFDEAAGAAAIDALVEADILAPSPLDFVHPLVRNAVASQLPPGAASILHGRAARLLADDHAAPERVAAHVLAAPSAAEPWVTEAMRAAAERAMSQGAPDVAARFLRRALDESPPPTERAQTLLELGRSEYLAFEPNAIEHLGAALEANDTPTARAEVLEALGRAQLSVGRTVDAVDSFAQAVDLLEAEDPGRALELDAELVALAQMDVFPAEAIESRLARREVPESATTLGERMLLCVFAAQSARTNASASETLELARRAFAGIDVARDRLSESPAIMMGTYALLHADALEDVDRLTALGVEEARARGSVIGFVAASAARGGVACRMGNLELALAEGRAAFDAEGLYGELLMPLAAQLLIETLVERGDLDEAQAVLERAGLAGVAAEEYPISDVICARGRLRVAQGEIRAGLEDILVCGKMQVGFGQVNPAYTPWRQEAALAYLALDDRTAARELADEALALAREYGSAITIGNSLRVTGLTRAGDDGAELLREAVATLADTPARLEYAKSLVALGATLRRSRERRAARDPLRQGLVIAERAGALPLAERARAELGATGARPRRQAVTGVESLTPTERRVAEMAASGMTNREIAQALFVTMKTVSMHLTHVYRKLDVESRERLPEALSHS